MSIAALRELLRDERIWTVAARVEAHDGETQHYEVNAEGDIVVQVKTSLHDVSIKANLDSLAGGSDGSGVWHIPDPGTEVLVAFDDGDYEGEAYIVGRTSGGVAPDGLVSGQVFILGSSVVIRSPNGTAIRLPTLADLQAAVDRVNHLISLYNGHTHVAPSGGGPTAATTSQETGTAPNPTGTTVLEAE